MISEHGGGHGGGERADSGIIGGIIKDLPSPEEMIEQDEKRRRDERIKKLNKEYPH